MQTMLYVKTIFHMHTLRYVFIYALRFSDSTLKFRVVFFPFKGLVFAHKWNNVSKLQLQMMTTDGLSTQIHLYRASDTHFCQILSIKTRTIMLTDAPVSSVKSISTFIGMWLMVKVSHLELF